MSFTISENPNSTATAFGETTKSGSSYSVNFNTQSTDAAYYASSEGDAGFNYVLFHEVGHVLNGMYNASAFADEAAANTAGRSIESALGLGLMSRPPGGGYH